MIILYRSIIFENFATNVLMNAYYLDVPVVENNFVIGNYGIVFSLLSLAYDHLVNLHGDYKIPNNPITL